MSPTRREFLKMSASAALSTSLSRSIARALALPASNRTGSLHDVEHVVILMQENRSFDHYFGHLRGVRGYNDRFPVLRADGRPVWHQPRKDHDTQTVLPFRLNAGLTAAQCLKDLDHSWYPTHGAIAAGRNDRWPQYKSDLTMGYFLREDVPFHYALADAFTLCDHYFCSSPTSTHPNRTYLMCGTIDPTGQGGGPILNNSDPITIEDAKPATVPHFLPPLTFTTYPERLQQAGISWQIYQQGLGLADKLNGNFGCNIVANFKSFIDAAPGTPLHDRGMSVRTLDQFRADCLAGKLPQVSWLIPSELFSEHPRSTPGYGASYVARILNALTANPRVWSKTVFLVNYDENDGYFDHIPPPQPPTPALPGKSTVSIEGEVHNVVNPHNTNSYHVDNLPYGLGPRVPMTVISPWSKGGFVCSEVFDHTSVLRFLENRFGVHEPHITPWRRAICGDLTSAFDFKTPNALRAALPDTSNYIAEADRECQLPEALVPATSSAADILAQEPGTRHARAIAYDLEVTSALNDYDPASLGQLRPDTLTLSFHNRGSIGASFYVYEEGTPDSPNTNPPRRYTVEAGKSLDDDWKIDGPYRLAVMGPNGFVRHFHGNTGNGTFFVLKGEDQPLLIPNYSLSLAAQHNRLGSLDLTLVNRYGQPITVTLTDNAYNAPPHTLALGPRGKQQLRWDTTKSANWYDLSLTIQGDANYLRRLAGHIEDGKPSTSDPAATKPTLA